MMRNTSLKVQVVIAAAAFAVTAGMLGIALEPLAAHAQVAAASYPPCTRTRIDQCLQTTRSPRPPEAGGQ